MPAHPLPTYAQERRAPHISSTRFHHHRPSLGFLSAPTGFLSSRVPLTGSSRVPLSVPLLSGSTLGPSPFGFLSRVPLGFHSPVHQLCSRSHRIASLAARKGSRRAPDGLPTGSRRAPNGLPTGSRRATDGLPITPEWSSCSAGRQRRVGEPERSREEPEGGTRSFGRF